MRNPVRRERRERTVTDPFTRFDLTVLLDPRRGPCVSAFLPPRRGGSGQDPIRCKNLLR